MAKLKNKIGAWLAHVGGLRKKKAASQGLFYKVIEMLPIALPAGLAAFGTVAICLLLAGQLRNELVWPAGIAAALVAMWLVFRYAHVDRPGTEREKRICDLLVVGAVLIWGAWNVLYTSQHVLTDRDPATYAVTGAWLVHHDNLNIQVPTVFGDAPGVQGEAAGFGVDKQDKSTTYAQGAHLLPAFLGLGGRIVGDSFMLHLNPLFGATALLAIYAFARLFIRPRWALLAVGAMAVSLPLLYFSRDTYTEPLAATFTFGALALLWAAQKTDRLSLWFLAGFVAGAGALTRIDAYLALAGFTAFLAVLLLLAKKGERKRTAVSVGIFALGMVITSALGWLDVALLSERYYQSVQGLFMGQIFLIALTTVAGLLAVWVAWRTRLLARLNTVTRGWRGPVVAIVVLLVAFGLVSRPLWQITYDTAPNSIVTEVQQASGDPLEPRLYNELTAQWVAWYLGPLLAALGVMGMALVSMRAMTNRDALFVASLAVITVTSLVYFIQPSITPDQIWASRRFLPVTLPGLAIFGAFALDYVSKTYLQGIRFRRTIIGCAAAALMLGPLLVSAPFLFVRTDTELVTIKSICSAIPERAAILFVGEARLQAGMATRAYCGIPAAGFQDYQNDNNKPSQQTLAQIAVNAKNNGYVPIIGVYGHQLPLIAQKYHKNLTSVNVNDEYELRRTLTTPPQQHQTKTIDMQLGIIQADGSISRLK